jgi:cell division protein FtsB
MNKKRFIVIATISVVVTILLGLHVANLLFGKNSYEVYASLKNKQAFLTHEIKRLQLENARLQKEYFELKNLEPEE